MAWTSDDTSVKWVQSRDRVAVKQDGHEAEGGGASGNWTIAAQLQPVRARQDWAW